MTVLGRKTVSGPREDVERRQAHVLYAAVAFKHPLLISMSSRYSWFQVETEPDLC